MKLRYTIILFCCLLFGSLSAQTLDQARAMFTKGQYAEAKPAFEKQVKAQPNNANYNYWYGVCCLKTGEPEKAIKYLEFATKRKIQNGPLYLGQAYDHAYQFEKAVEAFEEYIEAQTKRKQSTEEATMLLERSKVNARMLKGVEDVCIIDSFIVDKTNFLDTYKISEESGTVYTYNEFFNVQGNNQGTVYETELGNKIYYSETGSDNSLNIFSQNKLLNEWSKGVELPGSINSGGDANYPFVLTDGITIYFASNGPHSMGGYDILVTRYNSGSETYLAPENVGMPFNSPYNDYMYVIDEFNDLGWFATDRHQPENKVCIYVFVPNTSRQAYNYEAMDPKKIRNLAKLTSIKDTWKDETIVTAAKERLASAMAQTTKERKTYDFAFIINDQYTYHSVNDFKSTRAKELFNKYQQQEKEYKTQVNRLEEQRNTYAVANKTDKDKMASAILYLEKKVGTLSDELDTLATNIRNEEIKSLKK
ncbi:tetratricopeptide repeat protein [Bacteroides sp. 51]|uniref:tetratricopeptide repeat protein n=1 Tax=Bacteroides sp. 51 TaxID=2302938 RepID=UPI0013D0A56C|nr:tetratricopeptide repeat protein [Bacteroides sp. 51]NDV80932.1 hypothetical protein [Bacteroides sp. 51]